MTVSASGPVKNDVEQELTLDQIRQLATEAREGGASPRSLDATFAEARETAGARR